MYSFSLYPLINKPTRVTDKSATLIDNIFCNNMVDTSMFNGIFYTDITDHFPVFSISVKNNVVENQHYTIIRQYTEDNISKFCSNIQTVGWDSVTTCTDCQSEYSEFYKTFITLYDKHFPPVKIKTTYRNRKSWLTVGLKKSIKIKNKLFLKSRKIPTSNNIINYKKYRNKLNSLLRKSERDDYDSLLLENKQDLKKTWNVIKQVINKKKSTQLSQNFKINNCNVTDNNFTIAEGFNIYFVNVRHTLAKQIPTNKIDPVLLIKNNIPNSIYLHETNVDKIAKIINSLKTTSPGWDNIHA